MWGESVPAARIPRCRIKGSRVLLAGPHFDELPRHVMADHVPVL